MSAASTTKYQRGDRVVVRVDYPPRHIRTPRYIQGKAGQIAAVCGNFPNPETLAYGENGLPAQPLYRVEFVQADIWDTYHGPVTDKLLMDIYEHWLEPAGH